MLLSGVSVTLWCIPGKHIAKTILSANGSQKLETLKHRKVQLSSRNPNRLWDELNRSGPIADLLPPVSVDVTQPATLQEAFHGADWVVSLVGIMHGKPSDFDRIQWRGAENVAIEAKKAGARLIHFSAIGADPASGIPYVRTKGLAEEAIFGVMPKAVVIRPSLVFGPGDDFFNASLRCLNDLRILTIHSALQICPSSYHFFLCLVAGRLVSNLSLLMISHTLSRPSRGTTQAFWKT